MSSFLLSVSLISSIVLSDMPTVPLYNAAVPGTKMPVIGIGTGSYGSGPSPQATPERWTYSTAFQVSLDWFSLGGIRWDSAVDYVAVNGTAAGVLNATENWTKTPRESIWITSKTGPGTPMGYNDTIKEWKNITNLWNTTYVDLMLIHWPYQNISASTDPVCNASDSQYSVKLCIQNTWKAYEYIFTELKGAKAIGVSNFEQEHIEYILELDGLIPSVNQIEFHGYWHEYDLVQYCQSMNITFNAYAPLGAPDVMNGTWTGSTPLLTQHPVAIDKANKYNKSPTQIWLRWILQQGMVTNPRSRNIEHMKENMNIFDFEISPEDMLDLASIPVPADNKVCHFPDQ